MDELEQLRILAKTIEADSTNDTETPEEDVAVCVVDRGFCSDPYEKDGEKIRFYDGGSSGNNPEKQAEPLFEKDGCDANKTSLDEALFKGMGLSREMREGFKGECEGCACPVVFTPGTPVGMCKGGGKSVFIVKSNDGEMIVCAKPTSIEADMSNAWNDGCWPKFSFQQDEIVPLNGSLDSIDKLNAMIHHNDEVAKGSLVGHTVSDAGQVSANEVADSNRYGEMKDMMDRAFGELPETGECINDFKCGIGEGDEDDDKEKPNFVDGPWGYFES